MTRLPRHDDRGASAVEYGLLVAAVAAVIVVVLFALGGTIASLFDKTCDNIQPYAQPTASCS